MHVPNLSMISDSVFDVSVVGAIRGLHAQSSF